MATPPSPANGAPAEPRRWAETAPRVFLITYMGYALLYFVRKPFGVVKHDIADKYGLATSTLAEVDMAFLFSYTISNLTIGYVEGCLGLYRALFCAFSGAAAATALFGCTDVPAMWMLCWAMQGTFQAWVYPLCAKLVTAQFGEKVRNSAWGIWVTCQHVGGMLGTFVAAEISKSWGWRFAFFVPSVWVLGAAMSMMLLPQKADPGGKATDTEVAKGEPAEKPSLSAAIKLASIKELGFSYYCIKLVRYVGVLWLPFFLSDIGFEVEKAAILSIPFDVGGIIGGTFCGIIADALLGGRLLVVIVAMCAGGAVLCAMYAQLHPVLGTVGHSVILFGLGIMVAGPDANFGGAACMSAVNRSGGQGTLASAASGFVNSMGALGTVFTGVLVTLVRVHAEPGEGWMGLWLILAVLCALPCAALVPATLAEHRHLRMAAGSLSVENKEEVDSEIVKRQPKKMARSISPREEAENAAMLADNSGRTTPTTEDEGGIIGAKKPNKEAPARPPIPHIPEAKVEADASV